ncbi:hypothetical protein [Massilia sp. MS-15]|uniref:hypothetical protein n=1 Tax=Massilia sp. MS-15 TaxID=2878200 RepID=UPI001CD3127A|nr:hypothetical protein [Massilia sp. MS-15]MCA1245991.1 hypothetical protein [Massilia sp. MS-15]
MPRRERKAPYNGGNGLPIREEVLARFDETVITRNSYGARCLNTPGVLCADIDFPEAPSWRMVRNTTLLLLAAVTAAVYLSAAAGAAPRSLWITGVIGTLASLWLASTLAKLVHRKLVGARGGPEAIARARVLRFMRTRPDWLLHVYRTPAGLRLLATHRLFDPREPEVAACFQALGADPMYVAMCLNQHCFRARLTAKPWRIGLQERLRPRPGIWPVSPERMPQRRAWLERYDRAAAGFAACRFVESLGNGVSVPAAQVVRQLHDELSQARSGLPIA